MFEVKIQTGNAAFGEDRYEKGAEIARILREVADAVESGSSYGTCIDYNGNRVGTWGE